MPLYDGGPQSILLSVKGMPQGAAKSPGNYFFQQYHEGLRLCNSAGGGWQELAGSSLFLLPQHAVRAAIDFYL